MTLIFFSFLIFLSLIEWIVLIDVLLSWLPLFGVKFRPRFIQSITLPMYETVRRYIPSSFGGIDFAPVIIFIIIELLIKFIITFNPNIIGYLG